MLTILEKVKNGVLDTLFPATCIGCGQEGMYMCIKCEGFVSEAALICPACQQSSFDGEKHYTCKSMYGLEGLVSVWEYEGLMKSLLHYVKYVGVTHSVEEITKHTFKAVIKDKRRFGAFLSFLFSGDVFITYVPMHKNKEKTRGFNQAAVFAREVAKLAGKEVRRTLEKIRDTKPQINLTKEERLHSVRETFELAVNFVGTDIKKIILIDDVWTTGATMKECCRILKKAGVKEVWGFTIARTP